MSDVREDHFDAALEDARALQDVALRLRQAGQTDQALTTALAAQEIVEARGPHSLKGELWLLVGNCYADKGEYDSADVALVRAAESFSADSRNAEYAQVMISRGRVLAERGEEPAALEFFLQLNDLGLPPKLQSQVLNNIGVLYRRSGDLGDAIDFLLRDVTLCERIGDQHGAAVAHLNVASALLEADRNAGAQKHAAEAARLFDNLGLHELARRALS